MLVHSGRAICGTRIDLALSNSAACVQVWCLGYLKGTFVYLGNVGVS